MRNLLSASLGRTVQSGVAGVLAGSVLLAGGLVIGGCASGSGHDHGDDVSASGLKPSVQLVRDWMTGSFSSERQSKADPEYFDIRLHIAPIWTERTDGPWLYVEQARADGLDKPYRQRVYRLSATGKTTFASDVYEFKGDPLRFAGAYKDAAKRSTMTPDDLTLKQGCTVNLTWHGCREMFTGETGKNTCVSTLRGAAFASSEVTLNQAGLLSWDRGYDAAGKQVWGATKGGYEFVRVSADPTVD